MALNDDDSEETTVWERVRKPRRVQSDGYSGQDRRSPPPHEVLKWLPLGAVIIAGLSGYFKMESQVEFNDRRIEELRETDRGQWVEISKLKDR